MSVRQSPTKKINKFDNFPKEVVIFGRTFTVQLADLKPDLYGDCEAGEYLIRINKNHTEKTAYNTLFHEMIHGAIAVSGMTHILQQHGEELEEAIVACIEHAFADAVDIEKLRKI